MFAADSWQHALVSRSIANSNPAGLRRPLRGRVVHVWLALVSLGLSLTHSAAADPSPVAPAFAPGSLGEELARDVGGGVSVAVLPTEAGVLAISADGERRRLLHPGNVDWLLVDNRARVIWFGQKGGLWLIDSNRAGLRVEAVASYSGDEPVTIAYGKDSSKRLGVRSSVYDGHLLLDLSKSPPKLAYEGGIYDQIFEDQGAAKAARLKKISWQAGMRKRVAELFARGKGRQLFASARAPGARVAAVPAEKCEDPSLCGLAEPLGTSPFFYVTIKHDCGDACHIVRQLYDGERHEFVHAQDPSRRSPAPLPEELGRDLDDLSVAPGGEGFVSRGVLYHFRSGKLAGSPKQPGGGWLGSQWYVE